MRMFAPIASNSFVFALGWVAIPESSTITTRTWRPRASRTASVMALSVKEKAMMAISLVALAISATRAPRTSSSGVNRLWTTTPPTSTSGWGVG